MNEANRNSLRQAPAAKLSSRPPGSYRILGRPALDERPPLPAGHPLSWGLLTNDTPLHGSAYPYPVFRR